MKQVWYCACCGQANDTCIDTTAGEQQEFIEDCSVCCRPNVLTLKYNQYTEGYDIDIYLEDRG
ncbi:MAG: CPXCG motif-containing cysteine-rich protein [Candidatus Zixiibacteriota bacterium]|nr:MAG: CPXCG motif-containing cysteine-rich protein [candidate division Zixibacteria bacterium]